MTYENVIYQVDGAVAVIKFNRPKALNALNPELMAELGHALDQVQKDPQIKVLVLTGEGNKSFVAGADIAYMSELSPLEARRWGETGHGIVAKLEALPIPVVACVNGFALGGGTEMAMACDFIYASENAKFGQPEINLGLIPGFGGTQNLPRLVGRNMAKELCMTGNLISAQEAREIGLVNRVFPSYKLWEETMKTAKLIASKGRVALRAIKQCIDRGGNVDRRSGGFMEIDNFGLCVASPDAKEGMKAFLEKRKPDFKGELV